MYKIGQFSKITGAPIRTLRYYDNIDLLKPIEIDLFTGYRYYDEKQIDDYLLIVKLKEVGFSLEEIKQNWNNFTNDVFLRKKQELLNNKNHIDDQIKQLDIIRSNIKETKISKKVLTKER